MGGASSKTGGGGIGGLQDEQELRAHITSALAPMVDAAALALVSLDSAMATLEREFGTSLQSNRHLVASALEALQGESVLIAKFQPVLHSLVRFARFSKLSTKDCIKKLQSEFGMNVAYHTELIRKILEEEHTKHAMEEGTPVLSSPYILGEILGKGHYGTVRKAFVRNTKEVYAIKMISTEHLEDPRVDTQLRREIDIMKTLVHENVLNLVEVMECQKYVYLVLEIVDGGELFEFAAPPNRIFDEDLARNYFQQLMLGVYYCHRRGVAHRDLKPANLLVTQQGVLKVSDFGLSAFQKTTDSGNVSDSMRLKTCCGSPKYIAPEVVAEQGYNGFIADVWSCGIILYLMLAGRAPFEDKTVNGLLKKVMAGKYTIPPSFSMDARDLIFKLLVRIPEQRMKVRDILSHAWLQPGLDQFKIALIDRQSHCESQSSAFIPATCFTTLQPSSSNPPASPSSGGRSIVMDSESVA